MLREINWPFWLAAVAIGVIADWRIGLAATGIVWLWHLGEREVE